MKLYLDTVVSNPAAVFCLCQELKMDNMASVLVEVKTLHLKSGANLGFCKRERDMCSEKCTSASLVQGVQC